MVIIGDDFTLGFNPLLFGVARESLARSIRYLPSGWEQFREQLDPPAPPRESLPNGDKTDNSVHESLHCWKHWAEVRLHAVALRLELDLPIFDAGEVSVCPLLPPRFDNLGWLKSVHVHAYALVV